MGGRLVAMRTVKRGLRRVRGAVVWAAAVSCLGLAPGTYAEVTNPSFEDALNGWIVKVGSIVTPLADGQGGLAVLDEAGTTGAVASSSLYQDFVIEDAGALVFEYVLVVAGDFVGGSALPDAFTARLLDPDTLAPLIYTAGVNDYFYNDSPGNIDFDPLIVTRTPSTIRDGWFTVTATITTLAPGTRVRLQFDLLGTGTDDGQVTVVGVDGIQVTPGGGVDQCPGDPAKTAPGVCGCGIPDTDRDGDGVLDCLDGCPDDVAKAAPGLCGCGVPDTDSDRDGSPDCSDPCPRDPTKTLPGTCGCGVAETDGDGDGVSDCVDNCPDDLAKTAPGTCGCGVADTDTDADGVADCADTCPGDPNKTAAGICGCGVADTDSDADGTVDCLDGCPNDPLKTAPGTCGCGVADADPDADGVLDCLDNCPASANPGQEDTDGDGMGDACDDDTARPDPSITHEERRIVTVVSHFNACGAMGAAPLPCMLLALLALKCTAGSSNKT